jgi:hypothetical protein|tara:strand:- start:218 stop:433 length:216 start_codon:yes stop_codon:yes gene_type:complete
MIRFPIIGGTNDMQNYSELLCCRSVVHISNDENLGEFLDSHAQKVPPKHSTETVTQTTKWVGATTITTTLI